MTARFYIIRGCLILSWFAYDVMAKNLISQKMFFQMNFLIIFGVVSLALGLWLSLAGDNKTKLELALFVGLVGLWLGLRGLYESWNAFIRLFQSEIFFAPKAAISLFFGLLVTFLYFKSLEESIMKLVKKN